MNMNQRHGDESQTTVDTGPQTSGKVRSNVSILARYNFRHLPQNHRKWRRNGTHAARKAKPKDHVLLVGDTWLARLFRNFPGP